jgi:hypothetical protein
VKRLWRWYRARSPSAQWAIGIVCGVSLLVAIASLDDSETTTSPSEAVATATAVAATSTPTPTPTRSATRAATPPSSPAPTPTPKPATRPGTALSGLSRLPVKGRAAKTGYNREQFGGDWLTVAGCDMRNRILRRDLRRKTFASGREGCEVLSGRLTDPYTRQSIAFVAGQFGVDIDHVVALGDAWQKGAQQWSYARRVAFANDPLNLLAVDASANRQKGDGDAATWLPPNKSFRCNYVARQIAVKLKFHGWVTRAENDAMNRILTRCPETPLPTRGRIRTPAIPPPSSPPPRPPDDGSAVPMPVGGSSYANCDAVRAAGQAPLVRGSRAYANNRDLDRDGDGAACG